MHGWYLFTNINGPASLSAMPSQFLLEIEFACLLCFCSPHLYWLRQGGARKSEDWRYLVDAFRNREIQYSFSLSNIKTVYTSLGLTEIVPV